MTSCSFDQRSRFGCKDSPVIGFDYCPAHLSTPRGVQHAMDRVRTGPMFTVADLEGEIASRSRVPEVDYHTSALEKMDKTLTEVMEWAADAKESLYALDRDEWRFTDRTLSEQVRTEVTVYERALDREARVLKDVSKMAINEKIVSLGRAQVELMISIMMGTIEEMGLTEIQFGKARSILLVKFQEEANLSRKVEDLAVHQLENSSAIDVEVVD